MVACNLPDAPPSRMNPDGVLGRRVGSVGRMMPGICHPHPRSRKQRGPLSLFDPGMLWLRGANVFRWLPRTIRSARPRSCTMAGTRPATWRGWTRTAFSSSRAGSAGSPKSRARWCRTSPSRQKIKEVWPQQPDGESHGVAVLGVPDEKKGEALVLLTTVAIDPSDLRKRLLAAGLPALWVPKLIKQVEALPLLATGKLDLRAAQQLAADTKTAGRGGIVRPTLVAPVPLGMM